MTCARWQQSRRRKWQRFLNSERLRSLVAAKVRHKGGVNLVQAFVRNVGTCRPDVKGETQVEDP